tara:strand:- start:92 stop:1126 length:1035 start_codon:yes stop_codon:yes gene_type:complete
MLEIFLSSLLFLVLLLILSKKYQFLIEVPSDEIRKIHSHKIVKVGGLIFIPYIYIIHLIDSEIFKVITITSFIFLFIGFISDINKYFYSIIRFILMILIITIFILTNNFIVNDYNHEIINAIFLSSPLMSFAFAFLGLMFCVNGFNFIDGNNGLLLGVSALIIVNFILYIDNQANEIQFILCSLLIVMLPLFLLNLITGKILAGDTGSYFLGFFLGATSIYLSNSNLLNAPLIACIIFYPIIELFISFWRRLFIIKSNPFDPDNLHLHSLIYSLIKKNSIFKNKKNLNKANSLTSLIILVSLILISFEIYFIAEDIGYLNNFFFLCLIYLTIYTIIYKIQKNNY